MSAPAFTPGSWLIHAKHRWVVPAEDAFKEPADALPICQLRDPDERLTEDETLANGFLIAAAPELYDAIIRVADQLVSIEGRTKGDRLRLVDQLHVLRAAARKARGEQ